MTCESCKGDCTATVLLETVQGELRLCVRCLQGGVDVPLPTPSTPEPTNQMRRPPQKKSP